MSGEVREVVRSVQRPHTGTLTICTDASYSYQHKLATWACYIRTQGLLIKTGGVIRDRVRSPSEAELRGMANAVWLAQQSVSFENLRIIMYCDNVHALKLHPVGKKKNSLGRRQIEWWDKHIKPMLDTAASWETRHVKGHLPPEEWSKTLSKHYMNDWCDRHAHNLLRQAIRERLEALENANKSRGN